MSLTAEGNHKQKNDTTLYWFTKVAAIAGSLFGCGPWCSSFDQILFIPNNNGGRLITKSLDLEAN